MDTISGFVIISFFLAATVLCCSLISDDNTDQIELGKHWKTECKLIELNVYNGFLSNKTNRLNCDGVINNVSTADYNTAVSAYESSL